MIINGSDILKVIAEILEDSGEFESETPIYISHYVNDNPSWASNGWISVYKRGINYVPNTLGIISDTARWQMEGSFTVLAQYSSMDSGEECVVGLETLVQKVITVLAASRTLKGSIDQITNITVDYEFIPRFEDDDYADEVYFQQATITFDVEVDRRS
jgi:hypothetical protein